MCEHKHEQDLKNWTFEFFRQAVERIEQSLLVMRHKIKRLEDKMAELDDDVQAVVDGVSKISDQLTDFKTDFDAAIAKLNIGTPVDPATLAKLRGLSTTLGTMSDALTALDTQAEGISGTPTP